MGAGHETTATTAAAAIYAISAHPEVEARLVQELESVLGALGWGGAGDKRLPACLVGWQRSSDCG